MSVQLSLSKELRPRLEHGGTLAIGKRKTRRPVVTKRAMHIVLRVAEERPSLTPHREALVLSAMAKRFHVQTYQRAICHNHITPATAFSISCAPSQEELPSWCKSRVPGNSGHRFPTLESSLGAAIFKSF